MNQFAGNPNNGWGGGALPEWWNQPAPTAPAGTNFGDYGNDTPWATGGGAQPGQYDQKINSLYASIGKTPDMIDQQGRDFWGGQMAGGNDITQQFYNSAASVYQNNAPSPYQAQNDAGFQNYTGNLTPDQVSQYNNTYANSGYQGSATWDAMRPELRAGIMSGNVDVNTLSAEQRAAIPSSQTMYGAPDNNHPDGMGPSPTGGGGSSVNLQSYQQNPYLAQMGEGLRTQFTGFMNDGLAANRGNAVASGGVGGSRQGIAEARTMTDAGKGFDSALAGLYGNDYQAQMGRNLQQYGLDQNYRLGQRGLDLGFQNSNNSYNLGLGSLDLQGRGQDINNYNTNRQLDQSGAVIGANLYNLGQQGPWNTLNNANGLASPYTGNGTTTSNTSSGGGAAGAAGSTSPMCLMGDASTMRSASSWS